MSNGITRSLFRRATPGGVILCYHGVATPEHPSNAVANVPLDELLAAVRTVRYFCDIVPLGNLLERHLAGASTAGLVALTFDDAYASLAVALPHLVEHLRVPLTICVATDASVRGARFWWDRIDDLFPRVAAEQWREFENRVGLPALFRNGPHAAEGALRPLRQWILAAHQGRWPAGLEAPLAALEAEVGGGTTQRAMTWNELSHAARSPLVDFAVHTRTHPVLPLLDDVTLIAEVEQAHHELRARFPRTLPVLAAPFGLIDVRTVQLAAEAGMTATLGLAARPLTRRREDDPVPRLGIMRGLPRWRLTLHLAGAIDRLRRVRGRRAPLYPALPSALT